MGWKERMTANITRPAKVGVNFLKDEISRQKYNIYNKLEDKISPLEDSIEEIKDIMKISIKNAVSPLQKQITNLENSVKRTIDPVYDRFEDLEDFFISTQSSIKDNFERTVEPMMNTMEDVERIMINVQDEIEDIPENIQDSFTGFGAMIGGFFEQMQKEIDKINPVKIFEEIKGTLKIIIPLLIFAYVLIQFAPAIIMRFVF